MPLIASDRRAWRMVARPDNFLPRPSVIRLSRAEAMTKTEMRLTR